MCPAVYDLGQAANVVALSVTEGEDKPLKYPVMFRKADLVLLTKIDLLPHLPEVQRRGDRGRAGARDARSRVIRVSARTGEGLATGSTGSEARRPARRARPHGVSASAA